MSVAPVVIDFPYLNPDHIISPIEQEPASFFLDSSLASHPGALYSYVGIRPKQIISGSDNPWHLLHEAASHFDKKNTAPFFSGGLVGYLSYETARFTFPWFHPKQGPLPDYWFGFYDSVLVMDHQEQKAFLASSFISEKELGEKAREWKECLENAVSTPLFTAIKSQLTGMPDRKTHQAKLETIKKYLEAGDIYQINYTERFEASTNLTSGTLYRRLRKTSPVPYAALMNAGDFQIFSASPELFFEMQGDRIVVRPIKGTAARNNSPRVDSDNAFKLLDSIKDRAELLMITDLERNDLGRICQTGSVKVDALFEVESFAHVHHLVSTISGKLKPAVTMEEIFKALFPGGSVTGAPKIRAMQIIAELEEKSRSVYTGALGCIGPGCAQFNMPIRTLTKIDEKIYFHAGGGIVMDSEPEKEFEELMVKVKGMMEALGID